MKLSINWLKDYVDVDMPTDELAHVLTMTGLEVEGIEPLGQIQEGIDLMGKDDSEVQFLRIPMKVDTPIEGGASEGDDGSIFLTLRSRDGARQEWAEDQLQNILTYLGLMDELAEKVKGDDVDPASDNFMNWFKLTAPGKFLMATHDIGKDNNGNERVNWRKIGVVAGKAKPAQASITDDEKGWD